MKIFKKPIAALIILTMIVGLTATACQRSYRDIMIFDIDGSITISRDGKTFAGYKDMMLKSGDSVSVGNGGYLRLCLDSNKYVYLDENTSISLVATGNDKKNRTTIYVEMGQMVTEIQEKLNNKSNFEVVTPNTTMAIRGTITSSQVEMMADGSTKTTNDVVEGSVDFMTMSVNGGSISAQVAKMAQGESFAFETSRNSTMDLNAIRNSRSAKKGNPIIPTDENAKIMLGDSKSEVKSISSLDALAVEVSTLEGVGNASVDTIGAEAAEFLNKIIEKSGDSASDRLKTSVAEVNETIEAANEKNVDESVADVDNNDTQNTEPVKEEPTPEVTPTVEPTPEVTPTEEPTPEVTPVEEPVVEEPVVEEPVVVVTPTKEPTPEVTPTEEPTPEVTPTEEPTPEVTPTEEPAPEVTPTEEPTPEVTPTEEPTPEVTPTEEPTPEVTPTEEPTPEVTPTEEPITEAPRVIVPIVVPDNDNQGGNQNPTPAPTPGAGPGEDEHEWNVPGYDLDGWHYVIRYHLNGGSFTNFETIAFWDSKYSWVSNSEEYTLTDAVYRYGYTFEGWYTSNSYSGEPVTSITAGHTGRVNLFAKWEPKTFIINYNLAGGTYTENGVVSEGTIIFNGNFGTNNSLLSTNLERENYEFAGWCIIEDEDEDAIDVNDFDSLGDFSELTLTAKWKRNEHDNIWVFYDKDDHIEVGQAEYSDNMRFDDLKIDSDYVSDIIHPLYVENKVLCYKMITLDILTEENYNSIVNLLNEAPFEYLENSLKGETKITQYFNDGLFAVQKSSVIYITTYSMDELSASVETVPSGKAISFKHLDFPLTVSINYHDLSEAVGEEKIFEQQKNSSFRIYHSLTDLGYAIDNMNNIAMTDEDTYSPETGCVCITNIEYTEDDRYKLLLLIDNEKVVIDDISLLYTINTINGILYGSL